MQTAGSTRSDAKARTYRRGTLLSCDVFDTVMTRLVGSPRAVFLLLGRRLAARGLIDVSPAAFSQLRREAAGRARRNACADYDVHQIYDELQFSLGLSAEERAAILAEELALEAELLRPVPGERERLAQARASGARVVFLSDMYLESGWILSILRRHGLAEGGEVCYVSCEMRCRKQDGGAFRRMALHEAVTLQQIVHRGNDLSKDVAGARVVGVASEHVPLPNLNRYEELLETHSTATDGLASVMAGASRYARLVVPAASKREAALRDAAAGVGGPLLTSYMIWVLRRAQRQGLNRLYFMARDGWIMMRIAERLLPKLGITCELRYLHGGRRAWYFASVTATSPEDIFWAVDPAAPVNSVETFLRRIDVEPEEVADALESLGIPRSEWATPRPPAEHEMLWALARHPRIEALVLERAALRRRGVLAYLEQEGLLADASFGIVDVGWSGRVAGSLHRMLGTRGGGLPAVFFFARHSDPVRCTAAVEVPIAAYFSDYTLQRGHGSRINELLLELFCGAGHGVTTGYEAVDGRMVPVLDGEGNPALEAWGLPVVHAAIEAFAEHLWLDAEAVNLSADMRPAVAELFETFLRRPTDPEAMAWGSYPFEYGRTGVVTAWIATPARIRELPAAVASGRLRSRPGTEWTEARVALAAPATRVALRCAIALRRRAAEATRPVRRKLREWLNGGGPLIR